MSSGSLSGAIISPTTKLKGLVRFGAVDVVLSGSLEGNIESALGSLHLEKVGKVFGKISSKNVFLDGTLVGECLDCDVLDIRENSVISGDIRCRSLSVSEGAKFNGNCEIVTADPEQGVADYSQFEKK